MGYVLKPLVKRDLVERPAGIRDEHVESRSDLLRTAFRKTVTTQAHGLRLFERSESSFDIFE